MSNTASKKAGEETPALEDFVWDNSEKFFDVEPVKEKDEEPDPEEEEEKKPEKVDDPEKKIDEEEPEPFKDAPKEKDEEPDDSDVKFFTTLTSELKEKGILKSITLKENEEVTEEKFFELQDEEIENRVEETINSFIAEVKSEDGAAYLEYIKAGGKTRDFFRMMIQSSQIPEVNLENTEDQDEILKFYYRNVEGLDTEDINDKLDWLEESGKKKKYAEKYYTQIMDADKKAKQLAQEEAAKKREAAKNNHKAFVNTVKETLDTTDQVNGFTFTKAEKKELVGFISDVNERGNTPLHEAVNNLYKSADKQKLLLLAKLLKSDFDLTDLVKEVKTKVTKDAKSNLLTQKDNIRPASSTTSRNRSLSDYF